MSAATAQYLPYAIRQTREANQARKELPEEVQVAILDLMDALAQDPLPEGRSRCIAPKFYVYRHPEPLLEVTYQLDSERGELLFLHFAAIAIRPRKVLFISYCHVDHQWLERIGKWLKPLERDGLIECWDDRRIKAGTLWRDEIAQSIGTARAALLLVTQDFLSSDFIYGEELPPLLEAAAQRGLTVLWVAVGQSTVDDSPLGAYQCLNDPARPLEELGDIECKKELSKIYDRIKDALNS